MAGDGRESGDGDGGEDIGGDAERYRRLIEYSTDLITIIDPDGTFQFVSAAAEEILDFRPEDLVGEDAFDRMHPADRDRVFEAFTELVEQPDGLRGVTFRFETADGDWVWVETRGKNLLDDEVIDGIVVVARDVTTRIRRVNSLETLHDRTREMFHAESAVEIAEIAADTAAAVLDYPITVVRFLATDGKHLDPVAVSDQARTVLGERPSYEVGEGTAGRAFLVGQPKLYDDLAELEDEFDRGEARSGLFVPIGRYGVLSIGHTEPGALDQEDVQFGRILAGNVEVALDRLERERELERQNERLEEFASVISHDLRSPLNVASGRLDLLDADPEQVEPIEKAIGRMEELIEDVLALARKGQMVDETEAVSLPEMAETCWRTVATGGATIEVETDMSIQADPGRLPEVFENLYRNAIEHGGEDVTVTIGALEGGFFVEDDGEGIDPDHHEQVFESGFSTTISGHGFGLAIVKQIAEAHGWSVAATDSASGGARFEFTGVRVEE